MSMRSLGVRTSAKMAHREKGGARGDGGGGDGEGGKGDVSGGDGKDGAGEGSDTVSSRLVVPKNVHRAIRRAAIAQERKTVGESAGKSVEAKRREKVYGKLVCSLGKGDSFGEAAMILPSFARNETVVVAEALIAVVIPRNTYREIITADEHGKHMIRERLFADSLGTRVMYRCNAAHSSCTACSIRAFTVYQERDHNTF